ncbi:hypothetical protein [Streptomyces sp. S.PNR 29]|uniref:hypothetical protein n=1 Tax=Streptomyces sp. S.PNR 29 TaxID=2973805 RepID=UPI0025B20790|nr:hypothetical protein [Streptomyces sp. S.PNR 29]MDN0200505.1 hypothetical protein [Streptomyces sp. S.PNR 29]
MLAGHGGREAAEHPSFEPRTRERAGQIAARSIACVNTGRRPSGPSGRAPAASGARAVADAWGVGDGVETVRLLLAVA